MTEYSAIRLQRDGAVARITLNRPEVRNAFNEAVIADLTAAFAELSTDPSLRAVVLAAEGKAFCAG
ncbi:enoyl-CoA hydratase-related protein, partial [Roseateles sp. GG27B]